MMNWANLSHFAPIISTKVPKLAIQRSSTSILNHLGPTTSGLFPLSKVLKTETAVLLAGRVDPVAAGDEVVVVVEVVS